MYAHVRARFNRRALTGALMTVGVIVLAGCDTQPATDVHATAATLNSKGACYAGVGGWWRYQIRDVTAGGSFHGVGPQHDFSCSSNSAEYPLQAERIGGLTPGRVYEFRIRTQLSNGQAVTFDSVGANGGSNYDWFHTPINAGAHEVHPPETQVSHDPDTGQPIASPSGNCGVKEIKNTREGTGELGIKYWTLRLTTMWKYCNGQVTKMYPAAAECWTTIPGNLAGVTCGTITKIRAVSQGGNPEHAIYSYSFILNQTLPYKGGIPGNTWRWCATNQISGSGAHRRHGSCDPQPW
jgi:hypothetical protein